MKNWLVAICLVFTLCTVMTSICLCRLISRVTDIESFVREYSYTVNESFKEQYRTNVDLEFMIKSIGGEA